MLVVQKYGGTSLENAERIRLVAKRVSDTHTKGNSVVVVVSAMGDTTDELIKLVKEISDDPPERELDVILSTGEQVSIALLSVALKNLGKPVISLTGAQAGIITDKFHTKARILHLDTTRLRKELEGGKIVVVAGFQGINELGDLTTLGRGGSDTTAVALAAALKADLCEIYTDVDGVYTTDPRIVPEAQKLSAVSFDEMLELADLGASVLHPRSIELAMKYNIPVHVRSSFNHHAGTIVNERDSLENTPAVVTGIAYDLNIAKFSICNVDGNLGIAHKLIRTLAEHNIQVDLIVQSNVRAEMYDISFTCAQGNVKETIKVLEKLLPELRAESISYDDSVAKVSLVGKCLVSNLGIAARMFEALAEEKIAIEMINTSETKISCVIKAKEAKQAVTALYEKFYPAKASLKVLQQS